MGLCHHRLNDDAASVDSETGEADHRFDLRATLLTRPLTAWGPCAGSAPSVLVCFISQAPTIQMTSLLLPALECFMLVLARVFDKSRHDSFFFFFFFFCVMITHHGLIPQHKRQTESP